MTVIRTNPHNVTSIEHNAYARVLPYLSTHAQIDWEERLPHHAKFPSRDMTIFRFFDNGGHRHLGFSKLSKL